VFTLRTQIEDWPVFAAFIRTLNDYHCGADADGGGCGGGGGGEICCGDAVGDGDCAGGDGGGDSKTCCSDVVGGGGDVSVVGKGRGCVEYFVSRLPDNILR
jgi:hypothetical protein